MSEDRPRQTQLYGAIDARELYSLDAPPTLQDDMAFATIAPEPLTGERIERYEVRELLGRGGMGEVLSVRDEQIGRSVAIKRLRIANPSDAIVQRFLREARIQGRLEHPAIVPVHELWHEAGGQPFFVMKQLAGTTLADVLPKLAKRDPATVERFGRQSLLRAFADVCLAIEFAHTRGIVHRDLKPANIVLGEFGEVYVLDWGVARVIAPAHADERTASFADVDTMNDTEKTAIGAILGTPGYIAPEQILGAPDLDGRADVYALGCILFELLALEPLHPRGQGALASALAGVDARPSLRAPDADIQPELDAICVRATAADKGQRFASARELAQAIELFVDGNRDLSLRRQLANDEIAVARRALAGGDRREAMRAAARALALDPTSREPAELIGALMLQVPQETPPEVAHELEVLDLHALRTSARFGMFAALAYLAFFPLLYWIGFRETWYVIAGLTVSAVIVIDEIVLAPKHPFVSGYIAIAGNLAMFTIFGYMVNPVVIGPGPAIIIITLLAAHRRLIAPWLLATLTVLATLLPWILRGITVSVAGTDMILHTAATSLDPAATIVGLVAYLVALATLATVLGQSQHDEQREVRRTLQLQSWLLRDLVPRAQHE